MKELIEQLSKEKQVHFAVWCARRVLHIFEEKHPEDKRPREALEAAEALDTNTASAYAYAAASAYAAAAAADASAYAAAASAYAAYASYASASYASAANAVASASYASAANADASAASASYASAADEERGVQLDYLNKLIKEQNTPIQYVSPFNRPQAAWNF